MLVGAVLTMGLAASAQQAPTQKELAGRIASGTQVEKDEAITLVLAIAPKSREPELEDAVVNELGRLNAARVNRAELQKAGQPVEAELPGEANYRLAVTKAVTESADPKVIPALVGALGSSRDVIDALARFGEKAVVPVTAAAGATHPDFHVPSDAMRTLQLMFETGAALSKKSVDLIVALAAKRMAGPQHYTHVIAGIDLAIATNDMTLRQRVDQLSTDRGALRLMGISDARQEQYVRDAALAALRR